MTSTILEGRFNNRAAIVTGGAQGISKEIAFRIAREGGSVVIADINEDVGFATALNLSDSGLSVSFEQVDIENEDSVRSMVGRVALLLGGIDILINNAGIVGSERTLMNMPDLKEHRRIHNINYWGTVACTHSVLPHMKTKSYGRIVSASSIVALHGHRGQTGYSGSKAAIIGFSKSVAREVGRFGITSNVVAPGFIRTAMMEVVPDEDLATFEERTPIGRLGEPAEVAGLYAYLASEEAGFMTGRVYEIDGGFTL